MRVFADETGDVFWSLSNEQHWVKEEGWDLFFLWGLVAHSVFLLL